MATITLTVELDKLENDELDAMAGIVEKILVKSTQDGKLAGKVSDVTELDREEDEDEDLDEEDEKE